VPHLRDDLIVAEVDHLHGSKNPGTLNSPVLLEPRRHLPIDPTKNKSVKSGVFFPPKKPPSICTPFTSDPPQIHHQKTTFCTPFFPKPPAKTGKPPRKKLPLFLVEEGYGRLSVSHWSAG
jgi:hypothetical protein